MSDLLYAGIGVGVVLLFYLISKIGGKDNSELTNERNLLRVRVEELQKIERTVETYVDLLQEANSRATITEARLEKSVLLCNAFEKKYKESFGKQKSEQVRLGLVSENIMPFLDDFGYDPSKVRGLFNPIDLIVFDNEEIVFVELKSGDSKLSTKQKQIKRLIEEKQVRFEVHRVSEKGYTKE